MQNKRFNKEIDIYKNDNFSLKSDKWNSYIENCFLLSNSENKAKFVMFVNEKYFLEINILIDEFYPFRPPKIFNKDNKIIFFSCLNNVDNKSYFQYYYNKIRPSDKCYCCKSILCRNNWSPYYGLSNILKEVKNILIDNLRIIELIHCKKIMEKYLNFEIPNIYYFI